MLPNISKTNIIENKETKAQKFLLKVLKKMKDSGNLNFDYTGSVGSPDVNTYILKALLSQHLSAEVFERSIISQTMGGTNGIFLLSTLLAKYYVEVPNILIPEKHADKYSILSGFEFSIEKYEKVDLSLIENAKDRSIIFLYPFSDDGEVYKTFNSTLIEYINKKKLFIVFQADEVFFDRSCEEGSTLETLLGKSFEEVAQFYSLVDCCAINIDTSRWLFMPGTRFGQLIIRFPIGASTKNLNDKLGILNRLTVSTPTKLGVDIARVLFEDLDLSTKFARIILE